MIENPIKRRPTRKIRVGSVYVGGDAPISIQSMTNTETCDVDDVMDGWHDFVAEQREQDLTTIITEEKLKEAETRKFLENAFRDGEIKTSGTDIDKIMPPVSRFGGGGRTQKKQTVIDKLKAFFEKYFGVGGAFKAEEEIRITQPIGIQQEKTMTYDFTPQTELKVAEPQTQYGIQTDKE